MTIRAALKLVVLAAIAFSVAFALRWAFFWNVVAVSWDQDPQSLWALGAAFMLRSIENLSAVVGALALLVAAGLWLAGSRPQTPTLGGNK